eukprot:Plantae.Rhodophyta-Purpureofilum_apyrenoidigerum.ctg9472.p1 GENE.Plantae.Rhodophyta-Purpureofilum_apyrenoidigerum.ctg9472~~Plantae.Rhodophyta-Purpureofilum_apyrenoidigerum.ctg9472.p1  ORF type:complete len:390 (-),score=87.36 Plantae.Rhodophyta-Purpureofilum_apyrenoidigerum.ctg9472:909-2078(-)
MSAFVWGGVWTGRSVRRCVCVAEEVGEHKDGKVGRQGQPGKRRWSKNKAEGKNRKPPFDRRKKPLSDLSVGEELDGVVRSIRPFGAYVSVGAQKDGLLHVRDMSVDFVINPSDLLCVGEKVKVSVKYVDPENKKLALSMVKRAAVQRRLVTDLEVGEVVKGTVTRISSFGLYVDIGAEVDGFVHVSSLWGERKRETLNSLRYGEKFTVEIMNVTHEGKKVQLQVVGTAEKQGRHERFGLPYSSVSMDTVLQRPKLEDNAHDDELDMADESSSGLTDTVGQSGRWSADLNDDGEELSDMAKRLRAIGSSATNTVSVSSEANDDDDAATEDEALDDVNANAFEEASIDDTLDSESDKDDEDDGDDGDDGDFDGGLDNLKEDEEKPKLAETK